MTFEPGSTHRVKLATGSYKIHVLAVLDGHYVAYKFYGKHAQRWHYCIDHSLHLEALKKLEDDHAQADNP